MRNLFYNGMGLKLDRATAISGTSAKDTKYAHNNVCFIFAWTALQYTAHSSTCHSWSWTPRQSDAEWDPRFLLKSRENAGLLASMSIIYTYKIAQQPSRWNENEVRDPVWQVLFVDVQCVQQRWALDWTWIGLNPDYDEFCWFWIRSGL